MKLLNRLLNEYITNIYINIDKIIEQRDYSEYENNLIKKLEFYAGELKKSEMHYRTYGVLREEYMLYIISLIENTVKGGIDYYKSKW